MAVNIDARGRCGHSLVSGDGSGMYLLGGVDDVSVGRESRLSIGLCLIACMCLQRHQQL